jgi:hypothetical protein
MTTHPDNNIFTTIRTGFAAVAHAADHVKIRHDRLDTYAATLPPAPPQNLFDPEHHYEGDAESTAAYVLALDAINFGSGYKPLMKAEGWNMIDGSIYFTVSTRLKQEFENAAPLTAAALTQLTPADCRRILQLPTGEHSTTFATLCASALNELGAAVNGSFHDFVTAHKGSAAALVQTLAALPHFHDVHDYKGMRIPILKRAQIAAADLHLAFNHKNITLFSDIAGLTMFADNAVPHVLRTDGILEYTPELAAKIAAGTFLPAGSAAEVELRACAGHAVELIAARKGLRAMDIDHILWHRSAENPDYRNKPTHRTLTHFY